MIACNNQFVHVHVYNVKYMYIVHCNCKIQHSKVGFTLYSTGNSKAIAYPRENYMLVALMLQAIKCMCTYDINVAC